MAQHKVNPRDEYPLLLRALCDRGVKLQPDNLIITKTSTGYTTLTYREHQAKTYRLASALSKWGVKIGDCVGSLMWNTAWHYQCYHAVSCMGAILHTLNLRLGPSDLGYTIRHAGDRLIIVDASVLELLGKVDPAILADVDLFVPVGDDGLPGKWELPPTIPAAKARDWEDFLMSGSEAPFAWPDIPETSLHAICYTSGTTGNPKGAAYSHRSTFLHSLAVQNPSVFGLFGMDVVLPVVPMFHVLSWGMPFVTLMLGVRTVFNNRFMDPDSILDCFADWRVTFTTGVPTVWQGVRAAMEKRGVAKMARALSLRAVTCGGSAPPAEMMNWYLDVLGVETVQGWGMTETNPLAATSRRRMNYHRDLSKTPDELVQNVAKAGVPLPGVEARITDPEDLSKDMPAGQAGELLVRGPWIIQEYFKNPAEDKFHEGWLITGDVGSIDEEGALSISDRSKDVIKSGGEWISSIDLENHIAAMPGAVMAAVVAVPHPRWDERPVAAIVLEPGTSQAGLLERVHEHCLKKFAKFQLPDDVVVWPSIPLTSTGKIDKNVIRDKLKKENYTLPTSKL